MEKLRANEFYESGQLSKPAPIMVLETIIRLCDEDNDLIKKVAELGITLWLADVERRGSLCRRQKLQTESLTRNQMTNVFMDERKLKLTEAQDKLTEYCKPSYRNREHTHHLVSFILRDVAKEYGVETANALIGDYRLTEIFGIERVKND